MTLKCLATGSTGNSYILTSDNEKHLILDAGITIDEIKKGLDFDIENVEGCIISHSHKDHVMSADKIRNFSPVWKAYLSDNKIQHTHLGSFDLLALKVPHNGCENVCYVIKVDNQTILYATDFEYIPWNLDKQHINVMLIEMNYQRERITDLDEHRIHTVLGHAEEQTTIDIIKANHKYLRNVYLCHMSRSDALDRELAIQHLTEQIPKYVSAEFIKPGEAYNINEIPF